MAAPTIARRDPRRQRPLPRRRGRELRRQVGRRLRRRRARAGARQGPQAPRARSPARSSGRWRSAPAPATSRCTCSPPASCASAVATDISPGMVDVLRGERRPDGPGGRDRDLRGGGAAVRGRVVRPRPRPRGPAPHPRPRARVRRDAPRAAARRDRPVRRRAVRARRPPRRDPQAGGAARRARRGAGSSAPGRRARGTVEPETAARRSSRSSTSTRSCPRTSSAPAAAGGLTDVRVQGEELLANWFGWFNRTRRGDGGLRRHPVGVAPVRVPRLPRAPDRRPRAPRAPAARRDLLQPHAHRPPAMRHGLVALGDSITVGEGSMVLGVTPLSWAQWLARALDLPYTSYAVNGAVVADVLRDQLPRVRREYDIACLYAGVNDARDPGFDAAAYERDLLARRGGAAGAQRAAAPRHAAAAARTADRRRRSRPSPTAPSAGSRGRPAPRSASSTTSRAGWSSSPTPCTRPRSARS